MKVITVKPEEQLVIVVSASFDDSGRVLEESRLYEIQFLKRNGSISLSLLGPTKVLLDQ
jgi:hypothetical protein